QWIRVNIPKRI
nr:Chain C, peptide [synthetic construct]4H26_F Chain F, peptide [synthetic construct]